MTPWTIDYETDTRFPSGGWTGFFLEPTRPGRSWMELQLNFERGSIHGLGRDFVGGFSIQGSYEIETGKCSWSKQYSGKHDVAYQGYNEGKGIWGVWKISAAGKEGRGGFLIWPDTMADPTGASRRAAEDVPVPESQPVLTGGWDEFNARIEKGF